MRQLPLIILAVVSIGVGVWLGNSNTPTVAPNNAGQFDNFGGEFTLMSDKGPISLSDFEGKVVPIYFGFTHCPDVCITSLNKVSSAFKALPEKAQSQIQPLFITVDPERDTAERVGEYARYFEPSIIGLSGTLENISEIAKRYFVIFEKVAMEDSAMGYTMDHSSIVYVVGREGKVHALVHHAETAEDLSKALMAALDET